jgi:hypothetical protein
VDVFFLAGWADGVCKDGIGELGRVVSEVVVGVGEGSGNSEGEDDECEEKREEDGGFQEWDLGGADEIRGYEILENMDAAREEELTADMVERERKPCWDSDVRRSVSKVLRMRVWSLIPP